MSQQFERKVFPVVNLLLRVLHQYRLPLSPIRIQVLLFFISGLYYAEKQESLLGENWYIWRVGPSTPHLHSHVLKYVGKYYARNGNSIEDSPCYFAIGPDDLIEVSTDATLLRCITVVVEHCKSMGHQQLYHLAHSEWRIIPGAYNIPISMEQLGEWAVRTFE